MSKTGYLQPRDIAAAQPRRLETAESLRQARLALQRIGQWSPNQQMGRRWALLKAWYLRRAIVAAHGRVHTLSFMVHDFMHARSLEAERIGACAFSVMTAEGPLSMCLHNAKRDEYILQTLRLPDGTV